MKDLDHIDSDTRKRIGEKIREYAAEPLKHARKLTHTRIGSYRFRAGDFRVIFDIDGSTLVILRIGHRKNVYR